MAIGTVTLFTPSPVSACSNDYVAKRGDSWWSIAEKHELTLNDVLKINQAKPSTKILLGESVCVSLVSGKSGKEVVSYSPEAIIQIIREEWPDELEERAIHIARRESKFNPRAVGIPNNCCYGLFQIYYRWHKEWLRDFGVVRARQLLDPRINARAALQLFRRNGGWGPWE